MTAQCQRVQQVGGTGRIGAEYGLDRGASQPDRRKLGIPKEGAERLTKDVKGDGGESTGGQDDTGGLKMCAGHDLSLRVGRCVVFDEMNVD